MPAPSETINPAFYQRPILSPQDRLSLQNISNPGLIAGESPSPEIQMLAHRVFESNKATRPYMGLPGAMTLLREGMFEGTKRNDPKRKKYEIFVDSGCVHGAVPEKLLETIQKDHPDRVFISDLVGSQGFSESTKKIYYNRLMNPIRNKLLPAHPEYAGDGSLHVAEFLYTDISEMPDKRYTPKEGFQELVGAVLAYNPDDSVAKQMASWNDEQIALWLWYFADKDQYHGQWMSTLDASTRQKISDEVERDVEALVETVESGKGDTETHYYAGNWDGKITMQSVSDGNLFGTQVIERITKKTITKREVIQQSSIPFTKNQPHQPLNKAFDYEAILKRHGQRLITELETLETDNCLHILGPYFALLAANPDDPRYRSVLQNARLAKEKGKLVTLHMHGVPDREFLFLHTRLASVGDNKTIGEKIHMLMEDTGAGLLLHPHEHDPKRNKDGTIMSPNSHIVYQYGKPANGQARGSSTVVTDINQLGKGDQLISVYTPKQPALAVTVIGPEEKKDLFIGTSLPSKVLYAPEPEKN